MILYTSFYGHYNVNDFHQGKGWIEDPREKVNDFIKLHHLQRKDIISTRKYYDSTQQSSPLEAERHYVIELAYWM